MGPGAALFGHHVFVDLETTGLDPQRDRVIELGALFVERGEVVARIQRLFCPEVPVPAEVTSLTGLDGAALLGCGRFEDFLPELGPLLRGWTLVAHNAEFERAFFGGLFERLDAPVLDSCELVHFLHPELPSHSLDALVRWTQLGEAASHRALKDCEDTFAVLCHVLDGVLAQGRGDDIGDLLSCLSGGAVPFSSRAAPSGGALVALLRELHALCRRAVPVTEHAWRAGHVLPSSAAGLFPVDTARDGAGAPENASLDYAARASRAYLRALERRACGEPPQTPEVSSWFKRRFPAVTALLPPPDPDAPV